MSSRATAARPLLLSALLILVTVGLGIAIRFGLTGLPWPVRKYGGSVLWAVMVYWVVSALLRRARVPVAALAAEVVAVAVEFFKRVHTPALEQFRGTTAGVLLLGREFSYADVVAYTLAILCAALVDWRLRMRFRA